LILRCPASSTCPHPAPERPPRTRCLSGVGAVEWHPGAFWAQCILILAACRGALRSKTRISFLSYFGSFAVWRGVEYGIVHAISACTGRVWRQFEICGYRRQDSKSACAPLCRRCGTRLGCWSNDRAVRPSRSQSDCSAANCYCRMGRGFAALMERRLYSAKA